MPDTLAEWRQPTGALAFPGAPSPGGRQWERGPIQPFDIGGIARRVLAPAKGFETWLMVNG